MDEKIININEMRYKKQLDFLIGSIQDTMEDYERYYEDMGVTKEVANEIISVLDTILAANDFDIMELKQTRRSDK